MHPGARGVDQRLTQPMANLLGIIYLVGKIKLFNLLFQGPLVEKEGIPKIQETCSEACLIGRAFSIQRLVVLRERMTWKTLMFFGLEELFEG